MKTEERAKMGFWGTPVSGLMKEERLLRKTALSYGYLWSRLLSAQEYEELWGAHYKRMEKALQIPSLQGWVLDAGCGAGLDLGCVASRPGVHAVGVELSQEGACASRERIRGLSRAHVLRADLTHLPFGTARFDFIFSYGVLHHMADPRTGMRELVRVTKPGGSVCAYLYEDFSERFILSRVFLTVVNQLRRLTLFFPPWLLYFLCQLASPAVFFLFAVPHRLFRNIPGIGPAAARLPFRHAAGPFCLGGDLYDRFAAPIEKRYSKKEALELFQQAGLTSTRCANDRGWMILGEKPALSSS